MLKRDNPNLIVHTHSTKAGILGRWAAFFVGVKNIIHTVHGFGFHEFQNKIYWLIIYLCEFFTCFITTHYVCVSEYDLNIGRKLLPGFNKKSSVINAAVDWDRFYIPAVKTKIDFFGAVKVQNFNEEKFILGTVSCFKPQKNLFDLLKAFKFVCDEPGNKNFFLQIIGDGILRKKIEFWILHNNMETKIELLGWQNDVSKWLKKWKIFVLSSLWEGLPCSVVEARLSRLPVVSYKIAGIPEVIIDGKNGFLIKPGDWKALAEKIKLISNDEKILNDMRNYEENLENFHNNRMIEKHFDLYRKNIFI